MLAASEERKLAKLLKDAGLTKAAVERAIADVRGGENVNDANAEEQRGALDKYTVDLTARAESGKLDPVIGRDDEDPTHDSGPAAANQEQSGADR